MGCPRVDSNHHAFTGTGPQPAAYTIPPRGLVITDYADYFIPLLELCQRFGRTYFCRTMAVLRAVYMGCCWLSVPVVSEIMNVIVPLWPLRSRTSMIRVTHVTRSPMRSWRV